MRRSVVKLYALIRANAHILMIVLFCITLWVLNARNSQLEGTNTRLTETVKVLRERNSSLYGRNDAMAHTMNNLTNKVGDLSKLLGDETQRRAKAELTAQQFQRDNEFLRSSKKCSIAIDPKAVQQGSNDPGSVIIQAAPADKP